MFHAGLDERAYMEFQQRQKSVAVSFDAVLIIATICYGHPFIPKLAAAKASKYFLWLILRFFFCRGRRPLMRKSFGLQIIYPANKIDDKNEEHYAQQE